jgi:hypothetical protein
MHPVSASSDIAHFVIKLINRRVRGTIDARARWPCAD